MALDFLRPFIEDMRLQNPGADSFADSSEKGKPVKSDPLTAIATSLFSGGGSQGAMPGLDYMGNFNPQSFISSTLAKHRSGGASGSDFTKLIGGLLKAL